MIHKPVFRSSYHVEVVAPEGVFLLSERGHSVLKGELHCPLAPLLDGAHTADEIADELAGEVPATEVFYALGLLEDKGYIVEANGAMPPERAAFWHGLGLDARRAEEQVRDAKVSILRLGSAAIEPFASALGAIGLEVDPDGDLSVVV